MNKDYSYFACDWVIDRVGLQHIVLVFDVAASLNLRLQLERKTSSEGYEAIRFIVGVTEKELLGIFVQKAASNLGLTNWVQVTKESFLGQTPHPHSLEGTLQDVFFEMLAERAVYNEGLQNILRNQRQSSGHSTVS